jgi:hypothetical protein
MFPKIVLVLVSLLSVNSMASEKPTEVTEETSTESLLQQVEPVKKRVSRQEVIQERVLRASPVGTGRQNRL